MGKEKFPSDINLDQHDIFDSGVIDLDQMLQDIGPPSSDGYMDFNSYCPQEIPAYTTNVDMESGMDTTMTSSMEPDNNGYNYNMQQQQQQQQQPNKTTTTTTISTLYDPNKRQCTPDIPRNGWGDGLPHAGANGDRYGVNWDAPAFHPPYNATSVVSRYNI
uniref:Uncharacterized protein n=1 Tax=Ciona intestinalis TaxID=7719 RepID=H2XVI0_CIOIN